MNKIKKLMLVFGAVVAPLAVFASTNAPIDLTSTGSVLAEFIAVASVAALGVFLGLYGIRIIIWAFMRVK